MTNNLLDVPLRLCLLLEQPGTPRIFPSETTKSISSSHRHAKCEHIRKYEYEVVNLCLPLHSSSGATPLEDATPLNRPQYLALWDLEGAELD